MENSIVNNIVRDNMLQVLVKVTNQAPVFSIPITILTHGFLISGIIASGKEYFDWMTSKLSEPFSDENAAKSIKETMDKWSDNLYGPDDSNEAAKRETVYIHLKNAKLFHPAGNEIPANQGLWWRGRIEEISGYTLGNLNMGAS